MTRNRAVLVATLAAAIGLGASAAALAHGSGTTATPQSYGCHEGWQMGRMMSQGQMPMMGRGQMGAGQMPMMGQGMMGPGMAGQGQMMGPGQGARWGGMQPLRQDLSATDVEHMMGHRLSWQGNPNVKVGKVEEKDDDTIIAEIVTKDGSLVQKLEVDRHTGFMRSVQ